MGKSIMEQAKVHGEFLRSLLHFAAGAMDVRHVPIQDTRMN
jgi:hypothetical protein